MVAKKSQKTQIRIPKLKVEKTSLILSGINRKALTQSAKSA